MTLQALILFGSNARADHSAESDLDLLGVSNHGEMSFTPVGKINLSIYPDVFLLEKAASGDLFTLHIVREGVAVYDPLLFLNKLQASFHVKPNYGLEIAQACDLGYFLAYFYSRSKNMRLINKRIAWCVRTILIARSVEKGVPQFSGNEIIQYDPSGVARELIARKGDDFLAPDTIGRLIKFLSYFGSVPDFVFGNIASTLRHFRANRHSLGVKSVLEVVDGESNDLY